jgi:lipoprotein-anchoring transpeptidase ErfK/SrfK
VQKPNRVRRTKIVLLLSLAGALLVSACSASSGSPQAVVTKTVAPSGSATTSGGGAVGGQSTSATPTKPAKPKTPVHIKLLNADGSVFGVGMPEIAYFSHRLKNATALQKATTVTVNGKPAKGAWYFEYSDANKGYPVEGHYRLKNFWPAHSKIHISIPAKGLSAGGNLAYDDSLTSDWSTGAANISTVDDSTHLMTVTSDGKKYGTFHVSLGAADTPTRSGIKVIMEKGASICMSGPGYSECGVKYTQRLTYDGEYLHAAPWNVSNIDNGVDSSNGCTNLLPADAEQLYGFLRIGDVVEYPNANGGAMQLGQGYGDWNVSWGTWQTGGLYPTAA